jgi:hypothetical protein
MQNVSAVLSHAVIKCRFGTEDVHARDRRSQRRRTRYNRYSTRYVLLKPPSHDQQGACAKAERLDARICGSIRILVPINESSEFICKATAKKRLVITDMDLEAGCGCICISRHI